MKTYTAREYFSLLLVLLRGAKFSMPSDSNYCEISPDQIKKLYKYWKNGRFLRHPGAPSYSTNFDCNRRAASFLSYIHQYYAGIDNYVRASFKIYGLNKDMEAHCQIGFIYNGEFNQFNQESGEFENIAQFYLIEDI